MSSFTPTDEQLALVDRAQNSSDNILVSAFAGAAKTASLFLLSEAVNTPTLALAFNTKIKKELESRFPSHVKAMTLNGLGFRTWREATGRSLTVDGSKNYNVLTELIKQMSGKDRDEAYKNLSDLIKLLGTAKQCGYIPTDQFPRGKRLMDDDDFFSHIEQKLPDAQQWLIREAMIESIKLSMTGGLIDFDDQIFMPTLFHGTFPRYPLTLVDEAQDLSALNHKMLEKLCGQRRLIAVGDSNQAIYGFRGAHEDSMNLLRDTFNMQTLTLSTTFRCPISVVEHVRWKTPTMVYPEWAKLGEVTSLSSWSSEDILPGSTAILCRNNAPLFSLALKLLREGLHVEVGGADLVKTLIKVLTKLGDKKMHQQDLLLRITEWEESEKEKTRKHGHDAISDRAECMRIFARAGDNLGDALAFAHHIMNSMGPLKLLTGHRAKGLEFDNVYILDRHLISKEDQDPNLLYVMQTRTRDTLTYIRSEDYIS